MKKLVLLFIMVLGVIHTLYAENIHTVIFDANSQPMLVGGYIDDYSSLNVTRKGVIVSKNVGDMAITEETVFEKAQMFLCPNSVRTNDPHDIRYIDCTETNEEEFACALQFLEGNMDYYVKAFIIDADGNIFYGNAEKVHTQDYNRYEGYADYGNVYHAYSNTLFDIVTDEIIDPDKGYYATTNENPSSVSYRTGNGSVYKLATEWNYKLWYCQVYHGTLESNSSKIVHLPIMKYKDGYVYIEKNSLDTDKNITLYYSVNGNYFRPETYTEVYNKPIEIKEPCAIYCYAISTEDYISYTNMYVYGDYKITENKDSQSDNNEFGMTAEIVDLGLSVKWSSWSLGATKVEDYGGLYGVGDPTGQKTSTTPSDYNYKENTNICGTEYDLAHVKWGGEWRLPTTEELKELMEKCTWESNVVKDGVKGSVATGPNGNTLFFPYSGCRNVDSNPYFEQHSSIWSGETGYAGDVSYSYSYNDLDINFGGIPVRLDGCQCYLGQSIRPVYGKIEDKPNTYNLSIKVSGNGTVNYGLTTVRDNTSVFSINEGSSATITLTPDEGYYVKSLVVNNEDVTSNIINYQYAINNISNNTTVEVEFEIIHTTGTIADVVNLGLSVKWASWNIGASAPEERGFHLAWGETEPKDNYDLSTYKHYDNGYIKYGKIDNKYRLESEDDAATQLWGTGWRMPTYEELEELKTKCTFSDVEVNGVHVTKVVGPNGNYIYFPYSGNYTGNSLYFEGSVGSYWSSDLESDSYAKDMDLSSGGISLNGDSRYHGQAVRPVYDGNEQEDTTFGKVANLVDLGLSVKWASWNVGASKIGDYGGLYGAGDPTGKLTSTNYGDYYFKDDESICGTEYDLAHVKWGGLWRMPSFSELEELKDKCTWTSGEVDGVKGSWVKGPNGNSIFLPWSGNRNGASTFSDKDKNGYYWSGDMGVSLHNYGYKDLDINSTGIFQTDGAENYWGQSIRPVYGKIEDKPNTYNLSIMASGNGTVIYGSTSVRDNTSVFAINEGSSATITLTPDEGCYVKSLVVNSEDVTNNILNNQYTISNIVNNVSVEIEFEIVPSFGRVASMVDLGLSVKWASWNLGASKIGDEGGLYGAGDPTGLKTSTSSDDYYYKDGESICGTEYDLAHVKWGDQWRMPSFSELEELKDKCTWTSGEVDGVKGSWVEGPNGNSIFLPCAGYREGKTIKDKDDNVYGFYWSGDMGASSYQHGYKDMDIFQGGVLKMDGGENYMGQSIRPVYGEITGMTDVHQLSIKSIGNGSVIYGVTTVRNNTNVFSVKDGTTVTITLKSDDGSILKNLSVNGDNVTSEVSDNLYELSNITTKISIEAEFGVVETITYEGSDYKVLSLAKKTVVLSKIDDALFLNVPSSISAYGKEWSITGVEEGALDNKAELAAIIWNPETKFDGSVSNPNLLLYVKSDEYVPKDSINAIVNNNAKNITLTDAEGGNNFYCPQEFTAEQITYEHNYSMNTGYKSCQGWETIVLPFDVSVITNNIGTGLVPYKKWSRGSSQRPFWLYKLDESDWLPADTIKANTPYIISMPNNDFYDATYNISGDVVFTASNVKVKASDDLTYGHHNHLSLVPNYQNKESASEIYALNVNNLWDKNTENNIAEGSAFVRNLRKIRPFEAYMTVEGGSATRSISIFGDDDVTGIVNLPMINNGKSGNIKVYTLSGVLVKQGTDESVIEGLSKGVYIINNRKVVVD